MKLCVMTSPLGDRISSKIWRINIMKSKQSKKLLRSKRIEKLSKDIGADASKLELEINQLSSIDASRMVNIHNRLSSNSYEIDVKKTSEKLLSFEQKLNKK